MMNLSDDTEELEDFIRLDFVDLQASENLQLLDPGIIDLECDSEDEYTSIKEPESFHDQPDLHSPLTTSHWNKVDLKPMCIKVVDCYKFPWYFDKYKNIIDHKIAISQSIEIDDGILDDSSTDYSKEQVDKTIFVDESVVDSVIMQHQANDSNKEVSELNKEIEVIAAKELLPITAVKSVRNNVRNTKSDYDIRRAMEQRKNSFVNLKKNIGLVGMKILRLPNKLPVKISISKQLNKRKEANIEKGQGNKHEKGMTSSSHVKALDKVMMNVTSTTPAFQETVEEMKDGVSTQNIIGNSSPELLIRSISALVEKENNSNDTPPLHRRCNIEKECSLELSVNKIAEEIYRLVKPHTHAGIINQTVVPNFCNTITTPTKESEEKNIKRSKYQSQKYIAEGTRTTKLIDPIPISPMKRKKDRMINNLQTNVSEIIEISDNMSPKSPSGKSEKSSSEAKTISNKTPKYMKNHKTKEMISKYKPNTLKAKPKIVLSTKKPNKLTETIIKIKEKQQQESSLIEPTKSLNRSSNTIPSSSRSISISENRSLPKQIDTQEQLLNENDASKNIESSSPKISIAQLQYSNRNDFVNTPSKDNRLQNTTKNDNVPKESNVLVKITEKKAENVSENNCTESAQIVTESSMTVHCDESNNTSKNKSNQYTEKNIVEVKSFDSTKEKLKQHHGTHRFPAVNSVDTATNNFAIPIVINRETVISCTKVDTMSNHTSKVTSPAGNTTTQNNQSPVMTEPLTVYNSMQAHTLYKPTESSNQTFRQSQCNAMGFPSHILQINQPNYTGHSLQDSTHRAREILPNIDTTPPSSGVNEKILPQMFHRLPMPPLQPLNFGAPMLNGLRPNMPTRMRHPGPNGVFGAQMPSNPRPMSSFGVSSQIYRPQGTVSLQNMPINYPQIPIGEIQSYDVRWSEPFSCIPPPPPPPPTPPPTHLPASQDISTSLPKLLPQNMDSSIIGRNINGIVKKINITAPVIKQKEEVDSKAGIIKIENLETDASTPLYDKGPTDCFEPVKTKKEMLKILDTGLQRVSSRFDVLTPVDGIQNKAIQNLTTSDRLTSKKENLLSQGKLDKLHNETTHEKNNSDTRKINSAVENFNKVDRAPTKEHQKNDKALPQKKENQHKSNHYLMNFIRKPKEKKDKKKEILLKNVNETVRNRAEIISGLIEYESNSIKVSANQSSCISKQIKHNEITKKPTSNHLKCIQDYKKGNKSIKLAVKSSKTTFEDLFGDDMDDADNEKITSFKKSTGKRHSGLVNTEKTSEKSYESSVNLKRPANDEKRALSPKYRPGPLSKKKKQNDQEKVNLHQTNKKQILESKSYSDPILPIPTYEKILSNMPSYLYFRNSSITSKYKKPSESVNPKIPDPTNNIIEKEKERLKLDKAESIKKISLYEYKKRSTSERKVDHEAKDNYKKKHVEMHRRPSHADSDLGYDSDSTVKL